MHESIVNFLHPFLHYSSILLCIINRFYLEKMEFYNKITEKYLLISQFHIVHLQTMLYNKFNRNFINIPNFSINKKSNLSNIF